MTNLQKMKTVAKMVAEQNLSKSQVDAVIADVARSTGTPACDVRAIFNAALAVSGR